MILCASIVSNKSLMEEATKCLFRTSLRSTHSTPQQLQSQLSWGVHKTAGGSTLIPRPPASPTWCNLCKFKEICTFPSVALLWQVSQLRFHRLFIEKYYKLHTFTSATKIAIYLIGYTQTCVCWRMSHQRAKHETVAYSWPKFFLQLFQTHFLYIIHVAHNEQ